MGQTQCPHVTEIVTDENKYGMERFTILRVILAQWPKYMYNYRCSCLSTRVQPLDRNHLQVGRWGKHIFVSEIVTDENKYGTLHDFACQPCAKRQLGHTTIVVIDTLDRINAVLDRSSPYLRCLTPIKTSSC